MMPQVMKVFPKLRKFLMQAEILLKFDKEKHRNKEREKRRKVTKPL